MSSDSSAPKPAQRLKTRTDWMRAQMKGISEPLADWLIKWLHPNTMTMLGLLGNAVGALFLAFGYMTVGGLFILLSGPFDGLDGAMARRLGQPTKFGAFVDSVTDRWSEMLILFGLLFYYLGHPEVYIWPCGVAVVRDTVGICGSLQGYFLPSLLVFAATMGSVMVSYTKARAEALGFDCNVGVLTRMERYLIIAPALVLNWPEVALWLVAIFANVTALQRAWHVRAQAYAGTSNDGTISKH